MTLLLRLFESKSDHSGNGNLDTAYDQGDAKGIHSKFSALSKKRQHGNMGCLNCTVGHIGCENKNEGKSLASVV